MIVFLGDSFTWGQGLAFERWINEDGKTPEYCNQFFPTYNHPHEKFSYKDDEYRKRYHFPALVSMHFDKPYVTKWGNGGNNIQIVEMIKSMKSHFGSSIQDVIDFFIIQFTDFSRDIVGNREFHEEIRFQIKEVNDSLKSLSDGPGSLFKKNWYGFSWRSDIGEVLKNEYSENYIPLIYKNIEYTSFDELLKLDNLSLNLKYNNKLQDEHFSLEGHEIITNSIIKKLNPNKHFLNI